MRKKYIDALEAVEICRRAGYVFPQEYTQGNWFPHEWVVEALNEAFERGFIRGNVEGRCE